jgi:hypothetical protein
MGEIGSLGKSGKFYGAMEEMVTERRDKQENKMTVFLNHVPLLS